MKHIKIMFAVLAIVFASTTAFTKAHKTTYTEYWFAVSNTVGISDFSSATLTFPSTVPPTSETSCNNFNVHMCQLAFPGYKLDANNVYEPSTQAAGGTIITDYSQRVDEHTKD